MSREPSKLGGGDSPQKPGPRAPINGLLIPMVFVGGFGALGFGRAVYNFKHDQLELARNGLIVGLVCFAIVAIMCFAMRKATKRARQKNNVAAPDKPWQARSDWVDGKIKSSSDAAVKFFLIWAFAALALSAPAVWHIPGEWQKGNRLILVALVFPITAVGLLAYSFAKWRSRRRFGDCYFEMAAIPGSLGGSLVGLIQTGSRLRLEHGLHLKLSCIRRTVSGSGDNRSTQESILWQDEKVFKSEADLPEPEPGRSGIPIHFKIPANQPECFARGSEAIIWRLEAKAKMAGPDFTAVFEVPVFRVAGRPLVSPEVDSDPTASLQMSAEEIRRDEHSKIQVADGPNGREFYFPAARNLGTAFMLTLFLVIWSGFLWMMIRFQAPILFPIVFGLFEVLIFWGCLQTWFKSSRVTVNSSGVTLQNHWLFFTRTRRFDAGDIVRFDTKVGMTSGTKAFHDLKLVTRASEDNFAARKARYHQTGERPPLKFEVKDSGGVTLASGIASKPEAAWLVKNMSEPLGR